MFDSIPPGGSIVTPKKDVMALLGAENHFAKKGVNTLPYLFGGLY